MAGAIVHDTSNSEAGSSLTITATTAGNTLVIYLTQVGAWGGTTPTVTDSNSDSADYTLLDTTTNSAFTQPISQFVRTNIPSGITSISGNFNGTNQAIWVREISGVDHVVHHSADAGTTGSSDTATQAIASGDTPAFGIGFGFGSGYGAADVTASGGGTQDAQSWYKSHGNYRGVASHQRFTSSGTYTVTTNESLTNDTLNSLIIVFAETAAAAAAQHNLSTLGAGG